MGYANQNGKYQHHFNSIEARMRSRLSLLLATPLLLALYAGCHDSICDEGEETCYDQVLVGGVIDDYAPGNIEKAEPAPELVTYMESVYHNPFLLHEFDQGIQNRPVGHTFHLEGVSPEHPAEISRAIVTMKIRARGSQTNNDVVHLMKTVDGAVKGFYYVHLDDVLPTGWRDGNEMVLTLDLSNIISPTVPEKEGADLRQEIADGTLHIYTQDDTEIDYYQLDVSYCTDGSEGDSHDEYR